MQAVLLCNALPQLTCMLWSEYVDDFPAAADLVQVLLAPLPQGEQTALLQEMLATGALLRLLMVMSQVSFGRASKLAQSRLLVMTIVS